MQNLQAIALRTQFNHKQMVWLSSDRILSILDQAYTDKVNPPIDRLPLSKPTTAQLS
ncbi:MAG: hypothetical protein V7K38_21155 [Nostoc sp.]|uniref:hypothetical protein n=1 Tax=Nostoc sp. TaxID=1180 RepID=UPI002FFADED7